MTTRGARAHDRPSVRWPPLGAALLVPLLAASASGSTFTVTTTASSGAGTLRQAILDANAAPGADLIVFNLAGSGPHVIAPGSPLPKLTDPVTIDATSQPGWAGSPVVQLDGSTISGYDGLRIDDVDCVVRGLSIRRFASGVNVMDGGARASVEQCWIGLDSTGSLARANSTGITIAAADVRVADCVVSGNDNEGIRLIGASNCRIERCIVGLDAFGGAPIGNYHGVSMTTKSTGNVVADCVISGNGLHGIRVLEDGTSGNSIVDNRIGLDAGGTVRLGNAGYGIEIENADSTLVTGNSITACSHGVRIVATSSAPAASRRNRIESNRIWRNHGYAIELGAFGVNGVDPLDADTGANELQNAPDLKLALNLPSGLYVLGTLHSTPLTTFTIELYTNSTTDVEGEIFLESLNVTTDAAGDATFYRSYAPLAGVVPVTAVAIDPAGNTSEYDWLYVVDVLRSIDVRPPGTPPSQR